MVPYVTNGTRVKMQYCTVKCFIVGGLVNKAKNLVGFPLSSVCSLE